MGVAINCSVDSVHRQGQTDELLQWINKLRHKKTALKKRRRKDLRVEAVVNSALSCAESKLRSKQKQRLQRWQMLKVKLCKTDFTDGIRHHEMLELEQMDVKTREEIDSINSFMSMLKGVKTRVER